MIEWTKLKRILILVETKEEVEKALRVLEEKRPELKWKFEGCVPTDYKPGPHHLPYFFMPDSDFENELCWGIYEYHRHEPHKKLCEIFPAHSVHKNSQEFCSCSSDVPVITTGFTTIYNVCTKCHLERK